MTRKNQAKRNYVNLHNPQEIKRQINILETQLAHLKGKKISADEARKNLATESSIWNTLSRNLDYAINQDELEELIQEEIYRLEEQLKNELAGFF